MVNDPAQRQQVFEVEDFALSLSLSLARSLAYQLPELLCSALPCTLLYSTPQPSAATITTLSAFLAIHRLCVSCRSRLFGCQFLFREKARRYLVSATTIVSVQAQRTTSSGRSDNGQPGSGSSPQPLCLSTCPTIRLSECLADDWPADRINL